MLIAADRHVRPVSLLGNSVSLSYAAVVCQVWRPAIGQKICRAGLKLIFLQGRFPHRNALATKDGGDTQRAS